MLSAAGGLSASSALGQSSTALTFDMPHIGHVFVIALENASYASTFGDPGADPYLASVLPAQGALLTEYYATGHESNDNYISMVSGQPPNAANQADCPVFSNVIGVGTTGGGLQGGVGCVYPAAIGNIGTQLSAAGKTWKAYEEDMGNLPSREAAACGHPAVGAIDQTQSATAGDGYAARHDPFVYFHSVIDNPAYCDAHVVSLGSTSGVMPAGSLPGESGLATDLRQMSTTPDYSFITPDLCDDGHDSPCTNEAGGTSALADIDAFLSRWVPLITRSPAFRHDGLLEITFDESQGPQADSTACCGETPGPGSPDPGITGPGGGLVGAVLLSPYIAPGTRVATPYNHYSSLATFEEIFHLSRLGEAATVTTTFGPDVFTRN